MCGEQVMQQNSPLYIMWKQFCPPHSVQPQALVSVYTLDVKPMLWIVRHPSVWGHGGITLQRGSHVSTADFLTVFVKTVLDLRSFLPFVAFSPDVINELRLLLFSAFTKVLIYNSGQSVEFQLRSSHPKRKCWHVPPHSLCFCKHKSFTVTCRNMG